MTEKQRVLLVENDPNIGGSGRSLAMIVASVDRERFELNAVCRPGTIAESLKELGVPCYWPKHWPFSGWSVWSQLAWTTWFWWLIRREGIALVHLNDVAGFRLVGRAAHLAGIPALCHFRMARDAAGLAWAFGGTRPDGMLFNSHAMAAHQAPLLPARYRDVPMLVVPNAVDIDRFRPAPVDEAKRRLGWETDLPSVTVISNLSPLKGQDIFLAAAREVVQTFGPRVRFHIVGRDLTPGAWFSQSLARQLRSSGLDSLVTVHGPIKDVVPVYQASDVMVWSTRGMSSCPSGNGVRVFQVGFPRCAIESAACGRPLVLSDTPGGDECMRPGETGLVVPQESPRAMAEAVVELLRNPERREAMGRAARDLAVSRCGLDRHGRAISRMYRETLNAWQARRTKTSTALAKQPNVAEAMGGAS